MPRTTLIADVYKRTLTSSIPELVQGDLCDFTVETVDSSGNTVQLPVKGLRASLGYIGVPPSAGWFNLTVNGQETVDIGFSAKEAAVRSALMDASGFDVAVTNPSTGCWVVTFKTSEDVEVEVSTNRLFPRSFVRVNRYQENNVVFFEIKLLQAPVAFSSEHERILPAPPTVSRLIAGTTQSDGSGYILTNEVQVIDIPKAYRGTYAVKWAGKTSSVLSYLDDISVIEKAINSTIPSNISGKVIVTSPQENKAYVEFDGKDLSGETQPLMEIVIGIVEPGKLSFSLDLDTAEVADILRDQESVELAFEVELEVSDNDDDNIVTPTSTGSKVFTLFQTTVTLNRELNWNGLSTHPAIDWIRPPQPKDYIPFSRDQILVGQQQGFTAIIGNGVQEEFAIDHGLNRPICQVIVVESATGRRLADTEYSVVFTDLDSVTISGFSSVPTFEQYSVLIVAVGPASYFQNHTHPMAQITGLTSHLDNLEERLTTVETLIPHTGFATDRSQSQGLEIELPAIEQVALTCESDPKKLKGQPPYMLPAIHDAADDDLTIPLPTLAQNTLWTNNTSSEIQVAGIGGIKGYAVKPGELAGCDGRLFYPVVRKGSTNSYYPKAFETELFRYFVNDKMMRIGSLMDLRFTLSFQLIAAKCNAQWCLFIESGDIASDLTPASTGSNISSVEWSSTPILEQRILIGSLKESHSFGVKIKRTTDGMMCDKMLYGAWEGNNSLAPSSSNFAIRARLGMFDTDYSENSANSVGYVYYKLSGSSSSDKSGSQDKGKVTISY